MTARQKKSAKKLKKLNFEKEALKNKRPAASIARPQGKSCSQGSQGSQGLCKPLTSLESQPKG
jgi:hypothetical protein